MDNQNLSKHKYLQLANFIISEIHDNKLKIGDKIPSVNQLADLLNISKSTVMAGLVHLSEKGIIESVYRKGYYVKKNKLQQDIRIFFLMDQLTIFKEELYSAFYKKLSNKAEVDVYFHNYKPDHFEQLIVGNLNNYTHFVIIPNLKGNVAKTLNKIPSKKRLILDYDHGSLKGDYSVIYQDFEADIYEALKSMKSKIKRYERLILVSTNKTFYSSLVKKGFTRFCKGFNVSYDFISTIKDSEIVKGDCYITLNRYDTDDVDLIKKIHEKSYKLGKEIGLISYNDFYVKEVLEGGITVISTDFAKMGEDAADLIIENRTEKIRNRSIIKVRNSL